MDIKDFIEGTKALLKNGIFYHGVNSFQAPIKVNMVSDDTLIVEFFDPKDVFMLKTSKRNERG